MERVRWTDERLDEKMAATDREFDLLRDDLRGFRSEVHAEFREFRAEVQAEFRDVRADLNRFQDRMVQIGFALVTVLIAAIVTIVLALA